MGWKGTFFGGLIGFLITKSVWGAVAGALIGQMIEQGAGVRWDGSGGGAVPIPEVFFRSTFEFMGHVAKSDGRVSESEIAAARRLMDELRLAPHEISAAIDCFRVGKSADFDADFRIEQLRGVCGQRYDLKRAFMELQLRAALAGNGISPPARSILTRAAETLGMSGLEFAQMESAVRARQESRSGPSGRPSGKPLRDCYAELEVESTSSDAEIVKAYRRQMSRHHPDKLVANGLPESMAQVAKEKTQRIQEAYEAIRAARGMR
jgi:DnaJ like chaperone protein